MNTCAAIEGISHSEVFTPFEDMICMEEILSALFANVDALQSKMLILAILLDFLCVEYLISSFYFGSIIMLLSTPASTVHFSPRRHHFPFTSYSG